MGDPVAEDKTVEPTEILTFLGIEFDTLAMELRLPNEKLVELKHTLELFVQTRKVTLRQLQSLISRVKSCHRVWRFGGDLLMRHVIYKNLITVFACQNQCEKILKSG